MTLMSIVISTLIVLICGIILFFTFSFIFFKLKAKSN